MDNKKQAEAISDALLRVYGILKMTPQEAKDALADLAALQQLALTTELLKDLSKGEVEDLNKVVSGATDEEKQKQILAIMQKRQCNQVFDAKVKTAVEQVIKNHIAYLKTRGDEEQKRQIANILSAIR